jgi:hypothetical protein
VSKKKLKKKLINYLFYSQIFLLNIFLSLILEFFCITCHLKKTSLSLLKDIKYDLQFLRVTGQGVLGGGKDSSSLRSDCHKISEDLYSYFIRNDF